LKEPRRNETRELVLLALLIALAVVLRGLEELIPNPLPWIRIGLANIMTLLAILLFGVKSGFLLTVLRVLIASLLFGTFLSPTFVLSFIAGMLSTVVMGFSYTYFHKIFSPVGISVLGGFTHNLVQLVVAYFLIVKHVQIFYLLPILSLIGIASGCLNGWIVEVLYRHIISQMSSLLSQTQTEHDKKLA
jgi:heptaprenyl diphosphate synthase